MKKIKNILSLSTLVFSLIVMNSCTNEDDYVPPYGDFSSLSWWSSPKATYNSNVKEVKLNRYLAFQDLSRGVISHEWKISAGSAFLNAGFTETDTLNYAKFIKSGAGLSTTEELAYVIFTEIGDKEVRLVNTFKDSVAESVNVGGVWKVDKLITVTVTE